MSKIETKSSPYKYRNTSGFDIASSSYRDGGRYVSQKSSDKTASLSVEHKYVPSKSAERVSTASSRTHDKLSEINDKLKKIAR